MFICLMVSIKSNLNAYIGISAFSLLHEKHLIDLVLSLLSSLTHSLHSRFFELKERRRSFILKYYYHIA